MLTCKKYISVVLILFAALATAVITSLNLGPESAGIFSGGDTASNIVWGTRFPRILIGVIVGIALASTGSAFQSLLKNPLADPYILGVSGGAALGSVIGVSLGLPIAAAGGFAFVFALLSMLFIYRLAEIKGRVMPHALLLTGVIFNAFAFAFIMLINSLATMEESHEILFLLMGNLEVYDYKTIAVVGAAVASGLTALIASAGGINLLSSGDETAFHLGLDIERTRKTVFFAASLMIGAVVSVCGLIGFVGLFIPHIIRRIIGPDQRLLIPASALAGGAFLVIADALARTILSGGGWQMQIPVGVVTALVGGPFFAVVLRRKVE